MKYQVVADWATADDRGVQFYGVRDNMESAEQLFKEALATERKNAKDNGYLVDVDDKHSFEAGIPGDYAHGHIELYITKLYEEGENEQNEQHV